MRSWMFLLIAFSLPVQAEVYKWTDENGKVHFGSQPPPQAEEVEIRESAPGSMITHEQRRYLRQSEQQRQAEGSVRSLRKVVNGLQRGDGLESSFCAGAANEIRSMQEALTRLPATDHQGRENLRRQIASLRSKKNRNCD